VFLGPHLLQAAAARRVLGRYARCADLQFLDEDSFLRTIKFAEVGADLVILIGNKGYFDQPTGTTGALSDRDIADLIAAPALIVTDGKNWGQSLAAMVHGFRDLSHWVQGVVVNRREVDVDENFWSDTFKSFGPKFYLGGLPHIEATRSLPPRLVSDSLNRTLLDRQMLVNIDKAISDNINLDAVIDLAKRSQFVKLKSFPFPMVGRCTRIAVAEDSCFSLCFQDNLELLRYFGADIVPFSPVADSAVPKGVGALYIPGAFLGEYAHDLAANTQMVKSIRDFADSGGIVYAEAGGAAYLASEYVLPSGESCAGVGLYNGKVQLLGAGSVRCISAELFDTCSLGLRGEQVKMLSLENLKFIDKSDVRAPLLAVDRESSANEGRKIGNTLLLSAGFQHWASNPAIAQSFVSAALTVVRIGR
jgi:cobyrinic acid a,c-diamide synthase